MIRASQSPRVCLNVRFEFHEFQMGRLGVVAGLVLAHGLLLFGLLQMARDPMAVPEPVPTVLSFIAPPRPSQSQPPPQQPSIQATPSEVPLPAPLPPAIETPIIVETAPEEIVMEPVQPIPDTPKSASTAEPTPKLIESVEYLREPPLRYPSLSRRMREQGVVLYRVLIDERGVPVRVEVERSSGYARLDDAGRDAVLQSRFRPYMEDGVPRKVQVLAPLRFSLKRPW